MKPIRVHWHRGTEVESGMALAFVADHEHHIFAVIELDDGRLYHHNIEVLTTEKAFPDGSI